MGRWLVIAAVIGVLSGLASAFFLNTLEGANLVRERHPGLFYFLPFGGFLVGWLYKRWGKKVEGGNNLVIDEFHDPKAVLPLRMAPLVFLGTILTHLFGGSAGREGTAVQMGASIADQATLLLKLNKNARKTVLMAGMAGGFGSVFGVPFAGTVFGVEVLAIGKLELRALGPCALASFIAHWTALACGAHHTVYPSLVRVWAGSTDFVYVIIAGIVCGIAARMFARLTDFVSVNSKRFSRDLPIRAAVGGVLLTTLYNVWPVLKRYAGLGVPVIVQSLNGPVSTFDWIGKLAMTALTLGVGFKGGEVTPLLFVGSTLGNALATVLPLSIPVLSSVGLVAVFAGAANTPIACTVMAMELFGLNIGCLAALACFTSYAVSGHRGIYHSQRIHLRKDRLASQTMNFVRRAFRR